MIAQWITVTPGDEHLAFLAPPATQDNHMIVIFQYTKARKVSAVLRNAKGTIEENFSSCDPAFPSGVKNHDYHVIEASGDLYHLHVLYADGNCASGAVPVKVPARFDRFGGSSTTAAHEVEQWRFSDATGEAVCGITIIVIDDIVGPDGSKP